MRSVCRYGNITEYAICVVPVTKFFTTARKFVEKKLRENPDAIAIVVVVVVACVCVRERREMKTVPSRLQ
jgi:hypothetical protein